MSLTNFFLQILQAGENLILISEFYGKGKRVRSPNEEDQTPPELRGCGQPSFVQPDLSPNGKQVKHL
jgi:hypothetical protein